jgi:hypothetical protein
MRGQAFRRPFVFQIFRILRTFLRRFYCFYILRSLEPYHFWRKHFFNLVDVLDELFSRRCGCRRNFDRYHFVLRCGEEKIKLGFFDNNEENLESIKHLENLSNFKEISSEEINETVPILKSATKMKRIWRN